MSYVELHCHSAYSFLDGTSQPEELAARAAELGYDALALTDHDGVYGSLEFAHAAKTFGVRPITGAEISLALSGPWSTSPPGRRSRSPGSPDAVGGTVLSGPVLFRTVPSGPAPPATSQEPESRSAHVTLLVETPAGYANLCRLLTAAHSGTRPKEGVEPLPPKLSLDLLAEQNEGLVCLSGCARDGLAVRDPNAAARLAQAFGRDRFFVELQRPYERGDARRLAALRDLAGSIGVPTLVTGDVHAHHPRRAPLQDVLVAVRHRSSLDGCEAERRGNHESILLAPAETLERFPEDADAVARTVELADRLTFDLTEELGYRYPDFSDS